MFQVKTYLKDKEKEFGEEEEKLEEIVLDEGVVVKREKRHKSKVDKDNIKVEWNKDKDKYEASLKAPPPPPDPRTQIPALETRRYEV
jgi:hypothetical protein